MEWGGTTPLWMMDIIVAMTTSKIQSGVVPPQSKAIMTELYALTLREDQALFPKKTEIKR